MARAPSGSVCSEIPAASDITQQIEDIMGGAGVPGAMVLSGRGGLYSPTWPPSAGNQSLGGSSGPAAGTPPMVGLSGAGGSAGVTYICVDCQLPCTLENSKLISASDLNKPRDFLCAAIMLGLYRHSKSDCELLKNFNKKTKDEKVCYMKLQKQKRVEILANNPANTQYDFSDLKGTQSQYSDAGTDE